MPLNDADVLNANEVAALLRVNRKTVYEMVQRKEIPVIPCGRALRFSRAAVLAWIENGSRSPRKR